MKHLPWRRVCFSTPFLLLILLSPLARAADDKLDLTTLGGLGEKEDPAKAAILEAGPGDKKTFTIKTDDNISTLKKGDIYTDGAKTYYTVVSVAPSGDSGGTLIIERTAGTGSPDRKLQRISSVDEKNPGPFTIVARVTLLDLYVQGGPFLHPIAILFFVMILLSANSIWIYRKKRQIPEAFVREATAALEKGDIIKFEEAALRERGLLPSVCRVMTDRFKSSTADDIQRRVEIEAANQTNRLKVPVKALNLIAVAAPLLGLLGTIVGMVIVFEAVATTTGAAKANALAAGIRVKLFSTAAALCVAIPALFVYFIFNTRLSTIIGECERLAEGFLHQLIVIKRREKSDKSKSREAVAPAEATA